MSLTIQQIEEQFRYITPEELSKEVPSTKMIGFPIDSLIHARFDEIGKPAGLSSSAVIKEIVRRFAFKHFQSGEKVNRSLYESAMAENEALENREAELVGIINYLKAELGAAQKATLQAPHQAAHQATFQAPYQAPHQATFQATLQARKPATLSTFQQKEQVLQELMPLFIEYLRIIGQNIDPYHLYAWIIQYIPR